MGHEFVNLTDITIKTGDTELLQEQWPHVTNCIYRLNEKTEVRQSSKMYRIYMITMFPFHLYDISETAYCLQLSSLKKYWGFSDYLNTK